MAQLVMVTVPLFDAVNPVADVEAVSVVDLLVAESMCSTVN
jgi:hypothetical protein